MAESYLKIQRQIADLQRKADALRQREVAGVIGRIKAAIAHYGLVPSDLFGQGTAGARSATKSARSVAPYSDRNGNSWGGRGPRPMWLRAALADGRSLDEFATEETSTVKRVVGTTKKRPQAIKYRGTDGQTWSGMGPRPRWLKEAIASGKALEDFAAN